MTYQVLYPTVVENMLQLFDDGPVFPSLNETFVFLWKKFGSDCYGAFADPFAIPFKNSKNETVAYVKRID